MEHSAKYNKVRSHFLNGYWTEDMVRAAAKSQKRKPRGSQLRKQKRLSLRLLRRRKTSKSAESRWVW